MGQVQAVLTQVKKGVCALHSTVRQRTDHSAINCCA